MVERRVLDEIAVSAMPAPVTRLVDGWFAKSAPELPFRRANSVLPPLAAGGELARVDTTMDSLEEWYDEQGRRVAVQVSFGDATADALDEHLAARGYDVEAPVVVKVGSTADVLARCLAGQHETADAEVRVAVDDHWAEAATVVDGFDEVGAARTEAYVRMLHPLRVGAIVAVGRVDGVPAGIGFGVLERGHLGIFGLRTVERQRRSGIATAVIRALVGTAFERDLGRVFVQVEAENTPARTLFVRLGLDVSHRYHYRVSAAEW